MQLRFFKMPPMPDPDREEELNRFLRSHRVTQIDRELVNGTGGAYWALCIEYLDSGSPSKDNKRRSQVDYREVLGEEAFKVFSRLRGCLINQFLSNARLKSALNSFAHFDDPLGSPRIASRIFVSISDVVSLERFIKQPLREWRKRRAESEGVPVYTVFTNEQLATIARSLPDRLTDLVKLEGIGEARIQKYGEGVLQALGKKSEQ